MKFFSVTFVVALFCAVAVSAAPSPFTREFSLIDESTFGLTDTVTKLMNSMIEKTKCTLDVMEHVLEGTELKDVYKKFRTDVETIIKVNVTECLYTKGLAKKLKCALDVQLKINSLNFNFMKDIFKTNTDVAVKVTKALYQCSKKKASFISNDEVAMNYVATDDEMTLGLTGIIEGIYDAMVKKTKCVLDAIEHIVGEGELSHIYQKLRTDVEEILTKDVKECAHTKGLIGKTKCFLTLQQKINKLYAKFISEVMKTNKNVAKNITKALAQCVIPPKPEEPKTTTTEEPKTTTTEEPESPIETIALFNSEMTYDVTDTATKVLNSLIERTKCTLDVMEHALEGTELETVYKNLRTEVESILEHDAKQCGQTEDLIEKLKCILTVTQNVNTLFGDFIDEVVKTNKDLATKLYNAIVQCAHKSY